MYIDVGIYKLNLYRQIYVFNLRCYAMLWKIIKQTYTRTLDQPCFSILGFKNVYISYWLKHDVVIIIRGNHPNFFMFAYFQCDVIKFLFFLFIKTACFQLWTFSSYYQCWKYDQFKHFRFVFFCKSGTIL